MNWLKRCRKIKYDNMSLPGVFSFNSNWYFYCDGKNMDGELLLYSYCLSNNMLGVSFGK